jgi:hypothetical protein
VATTAVLTLLSVKPRYPKLVACPKYFGFTLIPAINTKMQYTNRSEVDGLLNIGMILTLVNMWLGTRLSAAKPKTPRSVEQLVQAASGECAS